MAREKETEKQAKARRKKEGLLRLRAAYEALAPFGTDEEDGQDEDELTRAVFSALIAAKNVNREDSFGAELPRIVAQALAFRMIGIEPEDDSAVYGVLGDKIVAYYRALSVCKSWSDIGIAIEDGGDCFWGDTDAEDILPILKFQSK